MARKPRLEIPGFYHILNRGVERRDVFLDRSDFGTFEELLCSAVKTYGVTLHNFCLMSNHYHLLVEIERPTLSRFMRLLNMNYAIYFNKKYYRSGHLWQGRYKSWYVTDDAYLFTLMRYIEQNPLKAGIVEKLEEYPYSSYHYLIDPTLLPPCLKHSKVVTDYKKDIAAIKALLLEPVDYDQLAELKKASAMVEASEHNKQENDEKLKMLLLDAENKKKRNLRILKAYEAGFSQHRIAKILGLSQPTVYGIIKRMKGKRAMTIT